MDRRITLAQLSSSQLNSRTSLAPGRVSQVKKPNRKTMAVVPMLQSTALTQGRRSSAYGKVGTGKRTDPRPIGDKAYTKQCIHQLIDYLVENGTYSSAAA